jgi:hypothetical protein
VLQELWLREQLSALLLQTGHREAVLPDRSLLPTPMCLSKTCLLQPLLRGSQVLCSGSGGLLCSGSVRGCSSVLPGSGLCAGLLRSGSEVLPGSGRLLRSGSVRRCSSLLPGSGDLLCSGSSLLPGSGDLLCAGDVRS